MVDEWEEDQVNYTKIKVVFKDNTVLYISEDEVVIYQLSGDYHSIEYQNDEHNWHRTDGPAYEEHNYRAWWVDGKRHREGGLPAIEWGNGSKSWFENDKRHRLDGPAISYADGHKEWWVNGIPYSKEKFEKERKCWITYCSYGTFSGRSP